MTHGHFQTIFGSDEVFLAAKNDKKFGKIWKRTIRVLLRSSPVGSVVLIRDNSPANVDGIDLTLAMLVCIPS